MKIQIFLKERKALVGELGEKQVTCGAFSLLPDGVKLYSGDESHFYKYSFYKKIYVDGVLRINKEAHEALTRT